MGPTPRITSSTTPSSSERLARALAIAAVLAGGLGGCVEYLDPGEVGSPRYFGDVRGTPLPLLAPISDRAGNAYVLSGSRDLRQVTVFTGQAGGGWSSGCALHKADDRGAHGWIGRAQDHAWYWSGDALVEVDGATGGCLFVLDRDPASAANVAFLGVIPSVRDAPSRTSVVALIETPAEPLPYWVLVDLRQRRYTFRRFEPSNASNVVVLGTGAIDDAGAGVILVRYEIDGAPVVEAHYLDADANQVAVARVSGLEAATEDAVQGFLAVNDAGLASGILVDGQQVAFTRAGGGVRAVANMAPIGVHRFQGELFLVGTTSSPVISPLSADGSPGQLFEWTSSQRAAGILGGNLQVVDDRAAPRRFITWSNSVSALGAFPFLSATPPHDYAQDTTLWLVAGPSFSVAGEVHTQIALAPIGLTYP